ncbi:Fe-only nitrogenase accessory AnfO family protein [Desulfovibrio intestinalis]|uniref:Uncharacterized protein n=1 Tax=Desulfovibrio intestinalis TaxID=58621 RepID=A0A7W8BXU5_9BACT|nr:Fe-only nitrogenase accessory AnfO family protein [Desulfovibrio intestinalis]MBB5141968.1 hypothetical protein [Desulfovibrio intestinalis]
MTTLLDGGRIAVFMNGAGELAAPPTASVVSVYARSEEGWQPESEIAFVLSGLESLGVLREKIDNLVQTLGACRILLGTDDNGALYGMLDAMGFNICIMDRFDALALEAVRGSVLNALRSPAAPSSRPAASTPREIAPGRFFLDMVEAKEADPLFTSREAILVFFEKKPFIQLQVRCDHPPRWLDSFALLTGLEARKEILESGLTLLTINHPEGRDHATLTGQKWFDAGGCSCG